MTTYKEALKKSQGNSTQYIKLPIVKTWKLKDEGDTLRFAAYDSNTKKDEFTDSLSGVLIGSAMKMSVFDQTHGKSGGSYNSSHYFTRQDHTVIWSPDNKIEFRGTAEDGEKWLMETTHSNVKKRSCLFLVTADGLIEVETNVTLTIAQTNEVKKENKDAFLDKMVILTPATYVKEQFGKEVHRIMKDSIVKKNPPKYARIELGDDITEEIADALGVITASDTFLQWKEQIQNKVEPKEEKKEEFVPTNDLPPDFYPTTNNKSPF